MDALRQIRKSLTFGGLRVGMELARRGSTKSSIEALRWIAWSLVQPSLILRARLAKNMRCAGIEPTSRLITTYFNLCIDQLVMCGHIFRAGFEDSGSPEKFAIDPDTFRYVQDAYARGKGVLIVSPHLTMYPFLPRIQTSNTEIPCWVYSRRSKDSRKHHINRSLIETGGAHVVAPSENATRAQRLQVAIDVLRKGQCLYVTPDTPRKADAGVAVKIFGKTAYFPTGVQIMAMRTGAPIIPAWWRWDGKQYRIWYSEPIELARGGNLRTKSELAMQAWAKDVDVFLHEHPEMWWNWLDKRWTRILRETV
jgi:lauroyl/myristoyl acyltransferase